MSNASEIESTTLSEQSPLLSSQTALNSYHHNIAIHHFNNAHGTDLSPGLEGSSYFPGLDYEKQQLQQRRKSHTKQYLVLAAILAALVVARFMTHTTTRAPAIAPVSQSVLPHRRRLRGAQIDVEATILGVGGIATFGFQ